MVLLLAGCSSWFADKPKNPPATLLEFKETMAVTKAWSAAVGNAGIYTFSPAVFGDSVFVAGNDGTLNRIAAADGKSYWRINAGMKLSAGVGTDGETVAVVGEKGLVMAFDADGKARWKVQSSSEVLSAPGVGSGIVVVRSIDNHITAYDAASGAKRWSAQRPAPSLTLRSAPGIVISNGIVYVAMPGGKLLALAASNGGVRWEAAVGAPKGATELERMTDTSGMPVVDGADICASSYQGRLGCFNTVSGVARWTKELSSDAGVAVDERFVFGVDEHGALNAFSRDTGASVWRNDKLSYRRLSTAASFGRAVAVGDYQGYIHFLSREEGTFLARVSTDGSPIRSTPVVVGKNLIFQTQAGTVVALSTE